MANQIQVKTLGGFHILVNGNDIIPGLNSSKKKILLLQYLILNKDAPCTNMTIFNTIWPDDRNKNPIGALKTLISRLRVDLANLGLDNAIITGVGKYSWNPALNAVIDIEELTQLSTSLLVAKKLDNATELRFERAIALYGGELFPESAGELWVTSKTIYYHDMYMGIMRNYTALLEASEKYSDMVRVCRAVLERDPLDTQLNLDLMNALIAENRSEDAIKRYAYIKNLYMTQYKRQPPDAITEFYNAHAEKLQPSDPEIDELRLDLVASRAEAGVFVCDYDTFKKLYNMQIRTLQNLHYSIYLALVFPARTDGRAIAPSDMRSLMDILQLTLKNALRRECTICQYSESRYLILLPMTDHNTVCIILDRIQQQFSINCKHPIYTLDYKILPADDSI